MALADQAREYHHTAATNLWDADELQRKVAFQEAKRLRRHRPVTPGAEDEGKTFQTLRQSIRNSNKNRRTQIPFGSLLLETLDDMEDTLTTPAMEASRERYFNSQSSMTFYRSPVAELGSKKSKLFSGKTISIVVVCQSCCTHMSSPSATLASVKESNLCLGPCY
eukprot:gb/GECG01007236.1/.p1 GENE.gb/GECG01007236.1/~~gb/GECG01007236.1/.p1  ORF type:complete len:165 (+),score=20.62 gb/GECG01007236.1/:1-495(+)